MPKADSRDSVRFSFQEFQALSDASVSDACILDDCIAVSAHTDTRFHIHVLKIDTTGLTLTHVRAIEVQGEVTCLSLSADSTILAGIRESGQTFLGYGALHQPFTALEMMNLTDRERPRFPGMVSSGTS